MTALVVGTLLALVALGVVLQPLFAEPRAPSGGDRARPALPDEDPVAALREIEFDRATGKLSDGDYGALKRAYTEKALAAMRASDAAAATPATAPGDDPAEAAILSLRARRERCPDCGPRPEPDALWCSSCGRYLPGCCADCGATVDRIGARFCGSCGRSLAA
ncbi:MAG TPA: zinc ribbon domain-containing protein [Gemmatimonadaceae bacterium]|nr:zinc ribbon domain-containing protein [Gemmatimonadaceae bacterium]